MKFFLRLEKNVSSALSEKPLDRGGCSVFSRILGYWVIWETDQGATCLADVKRASLATRMLEHSDNLRQLLGLVHITKDGELPFARWNDRVLDLLGDRPAVVLRVRPNVFGVTAVVAIRTTARHTLFWVSLQVNDVLG